MAITPISSTLPPLRKSVNTYGDNGNILMLKYVAEKLGAHVTVDIVSLHDNFDENHYDIAFFRWWSRL